MPKSPRTITGADLAILFIHNNPGCRFKDITQALRDAGKWGDTTNFSSHCGPYYNQRFHHYWRCYSIPLYWKKDGGRRSHGGYTITEAGVGYLISRGHLPG